MSIKLLLNIEMPPPPTPEEKEKNSPTCKIDERIEYAVDCITCGHNEKEAILYLQKLHNALSALPHPKDGDKKRLDYIRAALSDHGYLMPD